MSAVTENELILANIFKFLPLRDLKTTRQACRLWRDIAHPLMQKMAFVKLSENIYTEENAMKKLLEAFATVPMSKIWFRNFTLSIWNFNSEYSDTFVAFWEKFGMEMETLSLEWIRFVDITVVRDVMFNFAPNLVNLTVKDCTFYNLWGPREEMNAYDSVVPLESPPFLVNRKLTSFKFSGAERQNHLPIGWNEIFIKFPCIKKLEVYNLSPVDSEAILELMPSLNLQLSHLNVFNGDYAATQIPRSAIARLISLRLPLYELSIDLGAHVNDQSVAKLLEQYRHLHRLIIYRGPLGTQMENFPFQVVFPNLEYLEMTETVADNIQFIQYMPNLKALSLCEPPEVEPPFLPSDLVTKSDINFATLPLPINLTRLRIEYDISSADVRKLVFWFPKVKQVKLYLDNDGFRTVCREWPLLEELEVLGDKLTNEGITGISSHVEDGIRIQKYNPTNISCLKELRKYVMVYYQMSTKIDDLSITEGFLKLKCLNHLELCAASISEKGWEKVFKCPNILTLCPSDGQWESQCSRFKKSVYKDNSHQSTKR